MLTSDTPQPADPVRAAPPEAEPARPARAESSASAVRPVEWAVLALILVVALAVRIGPLQRGLGFDELFTAVHFVEAPTAWQTASTSINFNNHVAYSLLARLADGIVGHREWALRLPALVLGLASLVVLWCLARPVVGGGLALAATAVMALSPEHVRWSTSARGYTGLLLGVLVMTGLLFCILRRPKATSTVALAVTTALAAYFHMYAVVVSVVQGAFLLGVLVWPRSDSTTRTGAKWALLALVGAGLLSLLLYLPILSPLLRSIQDGGRGIFWPGLAWSVVQEMTAASPDWMAALVLAVACVGVYQVGRTQPLLAVYTVAIAVIPVVAVILARPLDQYARFFTYVLPFLCTALVVGAVAPVASLRRWLPARLRIMAWMPTALGVTLLLWSWSATAADFQVDEGFRAASRALEAGADESVGLCAIGAGAELFQWYASRPLALPKTANELQQVARRTPELRCIYRPSSWESRATADLRRYLDERATAERYGDIVVYRGVRR